jgi:hypothetical protein
MSEVAVNENTNAGDKVITYHVEPTRPADQAYYILVINRSLSVPSDPTYRVIASRGPLGETPTPGPSATLTPTQPPPVARLFLPHLMVSGQPPISSR